jgi:Meiotically up-regulated gene 113
MSDYTSNERQFDTFSFKSGDYDFIAIYSRAYGISGLLSPITGPKHLTPVDDEFLKFYKPAKKLATAFVMGLLIRDDFGDNDLQAYLPITEEKRHIFTRLIEWADFSIMYGQRLEVHTPETIAIIYSFRNRAQAFLEEKQSAQLETSTVIARAKAPKTGFVYLLKSSEGHYKIGCTISPDDRLHTFEVKLPFKVHYEHLIYSADRRRLESDLHKQFASKRIEGEWFNLSDDDVNYIKSLKDEMEISVPDISELPLFKLVLDNGKKLP